MNIKRIMTKRFCLSFGAALTVASVLVTHRFGPVPSSSEAAVYVYFPSLCAQPGNANDCREVSRPGRPAFDSMAACSAHADVELRQENNPRLMATCMKQQQA